jgi:hypothetical protein
MKLDTSFTDIRIREGAGETLPGGSTVVARGTNCTGEVFGSGVAEDDTRFILYSQYFNCSTEQ